MNEIIVNRTYSGFPVSIGTGIALETIFDTIMPVYDDSRVTQDKIDTSTYTCYIINIATLLRNLLGSIDSNKIPLLPKTDILDALKEEIDWMTNFFQANGLNIKFYINNYEFVRITYGRDKKLRTPTTDKQILIDNIYEYCLGKLGKEDDVTVFSNDIKYSKEDSALILTHVPWDLLSYRHFVKLDLLESHTGVVKTRKSWNTKYYQIPDKDMSFLPFMEKLLVTFGDHVMFKPSPISERLELYEAMKKKPGINPLTSELSFSFMFGK